MSTQVQSMMFHCQWRCASCGGIIPANEYHGIDQGCLLPSVDVFGEFGHVQSGNAIPAAWANGNVGHDEQTKAAIRLADAAERQAASWRHNKMLDQQLLEARKNMSINADFEEFLRKGSGILSDAPPQTGSDIPNPMLPSGYDPLYFAQVKCSMQTADAAKRHADGTDRIADASERQAVAAEREAAAWEDIARSIRELIALAKEE